MFRLMLLIPWLASSLACAHENYVWADDLPDQAFMLTPYRIHPGDLLAISVWNQPNLSSEVRVRPDGMATLPLLGDIAVEGLTPTGCAEQIERRLEGIVVEPKVTVTLREARTPTISVVGEVQRVGDYPLREGDSILQIIARAGGLTEFADPNHIYVLRRRPELMRVRFTYEQLSKGTGRALSFRLHNGDIIVVE